MKRKQMKKLVLSKESLRLLEESSLQNAEGGVLPAPTAWKTRCPIDSVFVC